MYKNIFTYDPFEQPKPIYTGVERDRQFEKTKKAKPKKKKNKK